MGELPSESQIPRARSQEAFWSAVYDVVPGDRVRIRDAAGDWYDAEAVSSVEQGYQFPILWVKATGKDGHPYRLPWPIDAVAAAGGLGHG